MILAKNKRKFCFCFKKLKNMSVNINFIDTKFNFRQISENVKFIYLNFIIFHPTISIK